MLGKIEGRRRRGKTEDEMVGWHHQLNGRESEQAPGDSGGQGSLACFSPGFAKRQTRLSEQRGNWQVSKRDGGESGLLRASPAKGSSEFLQRSGSGRNQMEAGLDCLSITKWKEVKGWCHYKCGNRGSKNTRRCGSWSAWQSVSPCLTGCSSPALVPSGPHAEPSTW